MNVPDPAVPSQQRAWTGNRARGTRGKAPDAEEAQGSQGSSDRSSPRRASPVRWCSDTRPTSTTVMVQLTNTVIGVGRPRRLDERAGTEQARAGRSCPRATTTTASITRPPRPRGQPRRRSAHPAYRPSLDRPTEHVPDRRGLLGGHADRRAGASEAAGNGPGVRAVEYPARASCRSRRRSQPNGGIFGRFPGIAIPVHHRRDGRRAADALRHHLRHQRVRPLRRLPGLLQSARVAQFRSRPFATHTPTSTTTRSFPEPARHT